MDPPGSDHLKVLLCSRDTPLNPKPQMRLLLHYYCATITELGGSTYGMEGVGGKKFVDSGPGLCLTTNQAAPVDLGLRV